MVASVLILLLVLGGGCIFISFSCKLFLGFGVWVIKQYKSGRVPFYAVGENKTILILYLLLPVNLLLF